MSENDGLDAYADDNRRSFFSHLPIKLLVYFFCVSGAYFLAMQLLFEYLPSILDGWIDETRSVTDWFKAQVPAIGQIQELLVERDRIRIAEVTPLVQSSAWIFSALALVTIAFGLEPYARLVALAVYRAPQFMQHGKLTAFISIHLFLIGFPAFAICAYFFGACLPSPEDKLHDQFSPLGGGQPSL
ncbi:MAG: hypothetical protein GY791_02085 [Alphaproteobacteria bacterium]|nr:hypothetical protein [Alphaproteobacteria bacterium]